MKVYERFESPDFAFPEDMKIILEYLNAHGKILCRPSTIESLYFDFSCEKYCAGWISVNEERLTEFEEYLANLEY